MTQALPWICAALGALALGFAVVSFWQSVRAVLGLADVDDARGEGTTGQEVALFARKRALLEGLRELDFDHEAGKLSDEDHREERERLRVATKDVLRAIDAVLAPHRPAALALVEATEAQVLASASSAAPAPVEATEAQVLASASSAAPAPEAAGATAADANARRVCSACATENDVDATFCKRCGAKLATEALA